MKLITTIKPMIIKIVRIMESPLRLFVFIHPFPYHHEI